MAMWIVHRLAVKLCAVFRWVLATRGQGSVVTLAKIEAMIDVSVEMIRPVKPRPRPDKYTPRKPFRAIVTIRSTVIRRNLVISVRANRRCPDAYRNLRGCLVRGSQKKARGKSQKTNVFQCFHRFDLSSFQTRGLAACSIRPSRCTSHSKLKMEIGLPIARFELCDLG